MLKLTIAFFIVPILSVHIAEAADRPPTVGYWHVYTDADGVSHQKRCELQSFQLKAMKDGIAPQWQDKIHEKADNIIVTVQPVGWLGVWHENPQPQWIIPLSGRWFVETMDGRRVEMGPGEISFGEDQQTKADGRGYRGHRSGTVGAEPATLMIVQTGLKPALNLPCRIK